jgi:hypothetical protein
MESYPPTRHCPLYKYWGHFITEMPFGIAVYLAPAACLCSTRTKVRTAHTMQHSKISQCPLSSSANRLVACSRYLYHANSWRFHGRPNRNARIYRAGNCSPRARRNRSINIEGWSWTRKLLLRTSPQQSSVQSIHTLRK